jgi:hypothetical protein
MPPWQEEVGSRGRQRPSCGGSCGVSTSPFFAASALGRLPKQLLSGDLGGKHLRSPRTKLTPTLDHSQATFHSDAAPYGIHSRGEPAMGAGPGLLVCERGAVSSCLKCCRARLRTASTTSARAAADESWLLRTIHAGTNCSWTTKTRNIPKKPLLLCQCSRSRSSNVRRSLSDRRRRSRSHRGRHWFQTVPTCSHSARACRSPPVQVWVAWPLPPR